MNILEHMEVGFSNGKFVSKIKMTTTNTCLILGFVIFCKTSCTTTLMFMTADDQSLLTCSFCADYSDIATSRRAEWWLAV